MNQILRVYPHLSYFISTLLVCVWVVLPHQLSAQIISTVAGSNGGEGNATSVAISHPAGVAVDGSGNLFFVDRDNHLIRKVSPAGIITTVAGNGTFGYNGDGGQATSAQLYSPTGVAVDGSGNLFITDYGSHRIRRVDPGGIITTIAGTGTSGFSGDGGQATSARLNSPTGIAVDGSGNIFFADLNNHRIRRISPGGVITTVAGNGTEGFSGDGAQATSAQLRSCYGIAVDGDGNLFIADYGNHRIRKVSSAGIITTVAGNGIQGFSGDGDQATSAQLYLPRGVVVDEYGNIFIAELGNQRIRKVDSEGIIITVAGNGDNGFGGDGDQATSAQLSSPYGIAVDGDGNLFFADHFNNRIRKVSSAGIITTVAGNGAQRFSGDGGQATSAQLNSPTGVAVDRDGNLFFADLGNDRIRKVSPGGIITTVAGDGTYGYSGDGGQATSAQLRYPYGVAVDRNGNLFIADFYDSRIRRVSPAGIITTVAGDGTFGYSGDGDQATSAQLRSPIGVAVDRDGNLFIADFYCHCIRKVSSAGVITTVVGNGTQGFSGDGGQATSAQLNNPIGVAVDENGNLFIADQNNHRIRKVSPDGLITTVAGTGTEGFNGDGGQATSAQLAYPRGVTVDGNGNLFFADNNRIRKVSPGGIITTAAGTGTGGFSGDGGQATSAQLSNPFGVVVDGGGNLFFADANNNRIRKIASPASVIVNPVNSPTVCAVSPLSLTATAINFTPSSFSWSSQPTGISGSGATLQVTAPTVSMPTIYTITVTASDGILSPSVSITLTVNPLPTVTLSANGTLTCAQTSVTLTAGGATTYQFNGPGVVSQAGNVAVVNVAGTYSVTATGMNGCTATQNTTVESNTIAPTVTLSASGTLTCAQTSVTLTAGGGATYQFSGPGMVSQSGNVAVVNVAGLYSVTATGANGCTATQITTVMSNTTSPMATLSASGTLTCAQTSVTLTAGGGSTYIFSGPGIVSQSGNIAVVNLGGLYSVTATGANGCTAIQTTSVQSDTTRSSVTLTASGPLNCSTTSVTLKATPGFSTYVFSTSATQQGGQAGNTATVSVAGVYSVTAINAAGCSSTATVAVNYQNCPPAVATPISPKSATVNQAF